VRQGEGREERERGKSGTVEQRNSGSCDPDHSSPHAPGGLPAAHFAIVMCLFKLPLPCSWVSLGQSQTRTLGPGDSGTGAENHLRFPHSIPGPAVSVSVCHKLPEHCSAFFGTGWEHCSVT
jgi:hypothetical protein